jgi:uncharacterized protein YciI
MPTFIARIKNSPHFIEANLKAHEGDGKLPEDIAHHANAHLNYLKTLKAEGKVLCAGPIVDFTWGLTILRAKSIEEAKILVENDPGMKNGILLDYGIIPWYHMV